MGRFNYLPGLFKIPEVVLGLIILVLTRAGDTGDYFPWGEGVFLEINQLLLGDLVAIGFFVLVLVQLIGFLGGEKAPLQSAVGALIMGPCYIGAAGIHFDLWLKIPASGTTDTALAMASLAVIQGIVLLVDAVVSFVTFSKNRKST